MDNLIVTFIKILQDLPVEITSVILFITCVLSMLILLKLFGKDGLYLYNIIAVISANIQILRGINLPFSNKPVALGTIVFASTYLCSGILTEHFGDKYAKNNVWLCFAAQILMTLLMIIAIGHRPLIQDPLSINNEHMLLAQQAITLIFTPSPRLLLASLISFVVSQFIGIGSFDVLSSITGNKLLWLRTVILLVISMFVDTIMFNTLAWKILPSAPLSFSVIFSTYILWTLVTQILIITLSTPVIYISKLLKKNSNSNLLFNQ